MKDMELDLRQQVLELVVLNQVPYLSLISFLTGFVIGLVAHIRGKWLWV